MVLCSTFKLIALPFAPQVFDFKERVIRERQDKEKQKEEEREREREIEKVIQKKRERERYGEGVSFFLAPR